MFILVWKLLGNQLKLTAREQLQDSPKMCRLALLIVISSAIAVSIKSGAARSSTCTKSCVLTNVGYVQRKVMKEYDGFGDVSSAMNDLKKIRKYAPLMIKYGQKDLKDKNFESTLQFDGMIFKFITGKWNKAFEECEAQAGENFSVWGGNGGAIDKDQQNYVVDEMKRNDIPEILIAAKQVNKNWFLYNSHFFGKVYDSETGAGKTEADWNGKLVIFNQRKQFSMPVAAGNWVASNKILCTKRSGYSEESAGNHMGLSNYFTSFRDLWSLGRIFVEKKTDLSNNLAESELKSSKLFKLPTGPTTSKVLNGVLKLSQEGYIDDGLNPGYLRTLDKATSSFFAPDRQTNVFSTILNEKNLSRMKNAFDLGGSIISKFAKFKATANTGEDNPSKFKGKFTLATSNVKDDQYQIRRINPLIVDGKEIQHKFVITNEEFGSWVENDLSYFEDCPIYPDGTPVQEDHMCDFTPRTPDLEQQLCAKSIIETNMDVPTHCQFKEAKLPRAIETDCDDFSNLILTSPANIDLTLMCTDQDRRSFSFPKGSHPLKTNCKMMYDNEILFDGGNLESNAVIAPNEIKPKKTISDTQWYLQLSLGIVGGVFVAFVITIVVIVLCLRKKNKNKRKRQSDLEKDEIKNSIANLSIHSMTTYNKINSMIDGNSITGTLKKTGKSRKKQENYDPSAPLDEASQKSIKKDGNEEECDSLIEEVV